MYTITQLLGALVQSNAINTTALPIIQLLQGYIFSVFVETVRKMMILLCLFLGL